MTHKKRYLLPVILLVLLYLDGVLSFVFQDVFYAGSTAMAPRLILMGLILTIFFLPETKYLGFIAMGIGLVFDSFFFATLGVYTFIFPLMVYLARQTSHYFPPNFLVIGVYYLVALTVFESISFMYNDFLNEVAFNIPNFVVDNLAPTLLLNLFLFVLLYFPLTRLLLKLKN